MAIAPAETVNFEPGGAHILLMMLTGTLKAGDMVPFSLFFDTRAEIKVAFAVMPSDPSASAMSH